LRDDGTLWLNLGDSYATSPAGNKVWKHGEIFDGRDMSGHHTSGKLDKSPHPGDGGNYRENKPQMDWNQCGLKQKDLVGIPWRVAFALQADGWYLRSDIIWSKPNPMPESVTDRPTKAHEYVFLLTKKAKYYYDADAVREAQDPASLKRLERGWNGDGERGYPDGPQNHLQKYFGKTKEEIENVKGRNRRTVWEIATQPTPEAHFATFPEALVEPCIKAGSKQGDTILDPFGGSGTTGLVARNLKRDCILIELNPAYVKIMKKKLRLNEQLVV
jgi:DNA modification methylase